MIKGPDFPPAAIIGREGINEAYATGKGRIQMRARVQLEQMTNGKTRIVISELPYMVNKASLIEKIAELVRDKRVDGITDLRDESDRDGLRVAIEVRRDVNSPYSAESPVQTYSAPGNLWRDHVGIGGRRAQDPQP